MTMYRVEFVAAPELSSLPVKRHYPGHQRQRALESARRTSQRVSSLVYVVRSQDGVDTGQFVYAGGVRADVDGVV